MTYVERAVAFGPAQALVGIVTRPRSTPTRVGLLLLNAGLLSRTGPCRLHVRLARTLATGGVATLRFDLSGLGDSPRRTASRGADADVIDDIREALGVLQSGTPGLPIAAGGLCSASDAAFRAALSLPEIGGLLQLDPWVYPTPRFMLRRYGPSLLRPATWWRVLRGRLRLRGALSDAAEPGPEAEAEAIDPMARPFPSREWVASGYAALMQRGVRALCIYSGLPWHYCNYAGQLRDGLPAVPFGDRLQERYLPGADHLFTSPVHQREIIAATVGWLRQLTRE